MSHLDVTTQSGISKDGHLEQEPQTRNPRLGKGILSLS